VILNDTGAAFSMGAIGSGIWHLVKGSKNSPRVSVVSADRYRTMHTSNMGGVDLLERRLRLENQ
jgi:hypothetical protein